MVRWLKRIRGSVAIGLTWGAAWGFVVGLFGLAFTGDLLRAVQHAQAGSAYGFICGGVFSVALGIAGRRRTFDEMSLRYFAVGGAFAGAVLSSAAFLVLVAQGADLFVLWRVVPVTIMALMGAGCASGSLAVARMAGGDAVLEAGEAIAAVGLTDQETRELLGRTG